MASFSRCFYPKCLTVNSDKCHDEQVGGGGDASRMPTCRHFGSNPELFGLESNTLPTQVLYTILPAHLDLFNIFIMFKEQTHCSTASAHFSTTGVRGGGGG